VIVKKLKKQEETDIIDPHLYSELFLQRKHNGRSSTGPNAPENQENILPNKTTTHLPVNETPKPPQKPESESLDVLRALAIKIPSKTPSWVPGPLGTGGSCHSSNESLLKKRMSSEQSPDLPASSSTTTKLIKEI
jgi:hypothetical protein